MEGSLGGGLPVVAEGESVIAVALEHGEAGAGAIALIVELFVGTAIAQQAAGTRHQAQAEAQLAVFGVAEAVVGEGERRVLERRLVAGAAEVEFLLEVLEIHPTEKLLAHAPVDGQL